MLRKIHQRLFNPDAQTSRIVRESLIQMEVESARHSEQMGLKPQMDEHDDSASEVADQEDVEIAATRVVPAEELRQVGVHEPSKYEHHRLACGRVRSSNYLPCESVSVFGTPLCEQCRSSHFASRGHDD